MSDRNWLIRAGISLLFVSGCIVGEPEITYVVPGRPDASNLNGHGGAGGSRSAGGNGGAGPGSAGTMVQGGAGGAGMGGAGTAGMGGGGMGGAAGAAPDGGKGGLAGAGGGAPDAGRDAGGASGDADLGVDARADVGDTGAGDTDGSVGGSAGSGGTSGGTGGGPGTGGIGGGITAGAGGIGGKGGGTGGGPGTGGIGGGVTAGAGGAGVGGVAGSGSGGAAGKGGSGNSGGGDASVDRAPDAPTGGSGTFTEFPIPTPNAGAYDIVRGTDGNLWFTEETGNKIGRITPAGVITEYSLPTADAAPRGLTACGTRIYFTESAANKIGYLETSNPAAITEVPSLAGPTGMTTANDGTVVWYTAVGASEVVKLAADGTAAGHWKVADGVAGSISLVVSYNLWFGTMTKGRVAIADPTLSNGVSWLDVGDDVLGFPITDALMDWNDLIWFVDGLVLREFYGSGAMSAPGFMRSFVAGPPGSGEAIKNLYITMPDDNAILVKSGASLTPIQVPTANSTPYDIVDGPDRNLWFTEQTGNKIGRMVP